MTNYGAIDIPWKHFTSRWNFTTNHLSLIQLSVNRIIEPLEQKVSHKNRIFCVRFSVSQNSSAQLIKKNAHTPTHKPTHTHIRSMSVGNGDKMNIDKKIVCNVPWKLQFKQNCTMYARDVWRCIVSQLWISIGLKVGRTLKWCNILTLLNTCT